MNTEITAGSTTFDAFVLRRLRVAAARSRIITAEIIEIGVALSQGAITPEIALLEIDQIGAMGLLPTSSNDGE